MLVAYLKSRAGATLFLLDIIAKLLAFQMQKRISFSTGAKLNTTRLAASRLALFFVKRLSRLRHGWRKAGHSLSLNGGN